MDHSPTQFKSVTRGRPCPVCAGVDGCSIGTDGLFLCRRREGPQAGFVCLAPAKGDPQWTQYRHEGDPQLQDRNGQPSHHSTNGQHKPVIDWRTKAEGFARTLAAARRSELAGALGLPEAVLSELPLLGFCAKGLHKDENGKPLGSCWTFPETDAAGCVVGMTCRYLDGQKKAWPGGKRGLAMPTNWRDRQGPIFLPEGASDVLTLTAMGLATIGRPSNMGGVAPLAEQLRDVPKDRLITVLGELDANDKGQWPGREGAVKTAGELTAKLGRPVQWALPPDGAKDVRQWVLSRQIDPTCADAWHDAGEHLLHSLKPLDAKPAEGSQPITAAPAVLSYRPFPVELIPEPVREFILATAAAIGCDPVFVALPTLAALASAIGNSRRIELKRSWHEPCIIWAVIVAESGAKKSPPIDAALRPLTKRQHEAMKRFTQKLKEYRQEMKQYKRELTKWEKGKPEGDPPEEPEMPVCERCWIDDTTVEAVLPLLVLQWRGLLMKRDELSSWFGSFDKYAKGTKAGADAGKWLEMFGGRPIVNDRKTSGTLYVPRAALSVTGGIQPGILKRAVGQEHRENGLLARLLMAQPPSQSRKWTEANIDPKLTDAIHELYSKLFALEPARDAEEDPVPVDLPLTPDGKRAWINFYNQHADEQAELTGDLSAAWSKLEGYAARFALVVHCVRLAAGDPTLTTPNSVDADSIGVGVALSRWFGHEARRIYAILTETDEERARRELVELIRRKGGTATPRDLQRWRDRQFRTADAAGAALAQLVAAGLGRWESDDHDGGRGRPVSRFVLRADTDTNSANAEENRNCVSVSEEQQTENEGEEGQIDEDAEAPPGKLFRGEDGPYGRGRRDL